MIYDCFLYNGEADQLAMRVEELAPLDPVHVAVVGTRTFQGDENDAEIRFMNTSRSYTLPAERLRVVIVDDWPDDPDPWEREAHQRNAVVRGVPDAHADDLVIVSDADEIPRASVVKMLAAEHPWASETVQMRHTMYYFALDLRCTWAHDYGPVMLQAFTLRRRTAQQARMRPDISIDGGWHFSYLGGTDAVLAKMRAYSHTEFADLDREFIAGCIHDRVDYDDRGHLEHVPIDDSYPACIRDDPDRWKHLMWENVR